ncbi:hypothetical protein LAJ56_17140, partial [Streptococcus pneumoniae]|nr:hypothetical protein [Streptococcus pneumoniae]
NITDLQNMTASIQDQKKLEKEIEKRFLQEFRRAALAQENNPEQAKQFFTRALTTLEIGGYPEDRRADLINKAAKDNQSTIDRVN